MAVSVDVAMAFTLSPDQKGIETNGKGDGNRALSVHTEPRSKGD